MRNKKNHIQREEVQLLRDKLKEIIENQSSLTISDAQLEVLLIASVESLQTTRDALANLVEVNLKKPIRKENVSTFRNEFETKIRQQSAIEEVLMDVAVAIGRAAIVETDILDEEKTSIAIQQASERS